MKKWGLLLPAIIVILLLFSGVGWAQDKKQLKSYSKAKKLLQDGNFDEAASAFFPLVSAKNAVNSFTPRSDYYYAICLFNQKQYSQVVLVLDAALKKTLNNAFKPDAIYLIANAQFALQQYNNAMLTLGTLKQMTPDASLTNDISNLKQFYLATASFDTLSTLQQKYPEDAIIANLFVDAVVARSSLGNVASLQLTMRALKVAKQFRLLDAITILSKVITPDKVANKTAALKVAFLLPFSLAGNNPEDPMRKNKLITDLYVGMQLAIRNLDDSNIVINSYAYDTEKSEAKMQKLLKLPELEGMDLIIGPVYPQGAQALGNFCKQKGIPLLNPLATRYNFGDENAETAFLFGSSEATQAKAAAANSIKRVSIAKTVIFYGQTGRDSVSANTYAAAIIAAGGKVVLKRKLLRNNKVLLSGLLNGAGFDSTGHIYLASSDDAAPASQLVLALQAAKIKATIVSDDDILVNPRINLSQLANHRVYLSYPHYYSTYSAAAHSFKDLYNTNQNINPSSYAYRGFDAMMYAGKWLSLFGKNMPSSLLTAGHKPGVLSEGYDFTGGKDNKIVPIFSIEKGVLQPTSLK